MRLIFNAHRASAMFSERTSLSLLTASIVFAALSILPRTQLNDGDTLWHIVLGQKILESSRLPRQDAFSYSFDGAPYQSNSWFSDVLLASAYGLGGFAGVVILSTFCVSLTFFLLQREFLKSLCNRTAIFFCCAIFLLLSPHILSRPHVLAFPLATLWAIAVFEAEQKRLTPSLWSLPVLFLWANMHGSFLLAFVVTVPICLTGVFPGGKFDPERARRWALFLAGMAAMVVIGPYGLNPLKTALSVISIGPLLSLIDEWRPENFSHFGVFEAVLLATIGALTYGGVTLSLARIAILLGLLHMALSHTRNADYLAIFGSILLATPLASTGAGRDLPLDARRLLPFGLTAAIAGAVATLLFRSIVPPDQTYPANALRAARESGARGHVFNDYRFGGALIFDGVKVFIDSRAEFYPQPFLKDYLNVVNQRETDRLGAFLAKNDIGWTLLEQSKEAAATMSRLPGWREAYRDEVAVVHVRLDRPR
jgi:hypothetical protein